MQTDSNRPPFWIPNETIPIGDLSNREFLERFARAGRIGLSTGSSFDAAAMPRAQRPVSSDGRWGAWTHAFLFEGTRVDGWHWVVQSNLSVHDKQIHLGVEENRLDQYFDAKAYPKLAILDFGLSQEQTISVIKESLELVARRTRYASRELLGALNAAKNPALRRQEKLLALDESFFCSAFVGLLFQKVGFKIVPGLTAKNTAPEDLARSPLPHTTYLLQRENAAPRVVGVRKSSAPTKVKPIRIQRATTLKRGR